MTDIVDQLREAMHAAVDREEAVSGVVIGAVLRRHRRRTVRVTCVALLAIVAVLAVMIGARGSFSGTPPPATDRGGSAATKLTGAPMPAGTDISLLVSTPTGAAWYSTSTRLSARVTGLPASPGGYQFGRLTGGWWSLATNSGGQVSCKTRRYECVGPQQEFYFIADGSLAATPLGMGTVKSPPVQGHRAGTAWLTRYANSGDDPATTAASVEQVSTAGAMIGTPVRLPVGYALYGAVGSDLVIGSYNFGPPTLLWDPLTRSVVRRLSTDVMDSGPNQVAWAADCGTCQLRVLDVAAGRTISVPVRNSHANGPEETFSEDGKLLAVQLPSGDIGVVDTATSKITVLRGTALSSAEFEDFDWQGTSHRLIIRAGPNATAGPDQIAYWQPGDASIRVQTVRDPAELSMIETGSVG